MKFKCPHCNKDIELTIASSKIFNEEKVEEQDIIPKFNKKTLYVSSAGLNLRSAPEINNKNVITVLSRGTPMTVLKEKEKWFQVKVGDYTGWVSSFHLSEKIVTSPQVSKNKIPTDSGLPNFKVGEANKANGPNTKKLRKIINYEFKFDFNKVDLQCTEYVQYKFQQLGIIIQWPITSGRNGGNWVNIFEKYGPYKVFNKPSAGCAVSFTTGFKTVKMNSVGHIAYVEEVLKDNAIRISEANWPQPGKYNERTVPEIEWKNKHKCKFIKIM